MLKQTYISFFKNKMCLQIIKLLLTPYQDKVILNLMVVIKVKLSLTIVLSERINTSSPKEHVVHSRKLVNFNVKIYGEKKWLCEQTYKVKTTTTTKQHKLTDKNQLVSVCVIQSELGILFLIMQEQRPVFSIGVNLNLWVWWFFENAANG